MPIEELIRLTSLIIPIASFLALAVALVLFAKGKGNLDALREAAQTYRTLAEAYEAQIEHMGRKIERMDEEIRDLKKHIATQEAAMRLAVDEILAGLKRVK